MSTKSVAPQIVLPPLTTPVIYRVPGMPRREYAAWVIGHNDSFDRPGVHLVYFSSKDDVQVHGHPPLRNAFDVPFIPADQPAPMRGHCQPVAATFQGVPVPFTDPEPRPLVLAPAPPPESQQRRSAKRA